MSARAPPSDEPRPDGLPDGELEAHIAKGMAELVPHNRALGLRLVECAGGKVTIELPWAENLVGNPLTRVLHGGAITALLDATCGTAVFVKLLEPIPIATLDLRIDYLRPATPERPVHARAECFKVTFNVAFVRSVAFHPDDDGDLVAVANGTFIIFRGKPLGGEGKVP